MYSADMFIYININHAGQPAQNGSRKTFTHTCLVLNLINGHAAITAENVSYSVIG